MAQYFAGLDLGMRRDYTALCVLGLGPEDTDTVYEVRHLQRFPLATRYSEVADGVARLLDKEPLQEDNCHLVVDATGVGAGVIDLLVERGLEFWSVIITGGDKEAHEGLTWRVPKRNLIARPQVLLENKELKISPRLSEASTLVDELLNFRVNIDARTAHDSYAAWREGEHDDLVLALALAVWLADRTALGGGAAIASGPYSGDFESFERGGSSSFDDSSAWEGMGFKEPYYDPRYGAF